MVLYTDGNGYFYQGDLRVGDREATIEEIAEYEALKAELLKPKIVTKLQLMEAMRQLNLWDEFVQARASNALLNEYWLASLDVNRNHPMVTNYPKTDAEKDALFQLASTI